MLGTDWVELMLNIVDCYFRAEGYLDPAASPETHPKGKSHLLHGQTQPNTPGNRQLMQASGSIQAVVLQPKKAIFWQTIA